MFFLRILIVLFPGVLLAQIQVPVSMSATFVQKVTTPKKKTVRYRGTLRLNRSREFHWTYNKPSHREICGDGSRVRVIDHALEQVIVYKVGSLLDLMQLLKRAKLYRGDLYTARYHGTRYTLKVNAKGEVEQIAYQDEMDNIINIHFHKITYRDTPFASDQMRCVIPRHYDVIKG